jgi:hypothetical protein
MRGREDGDKKTRSIRKEEGKEKRMIAKEKRRREA